MRKPHLHQDWIDSHAFGIVKALQKGGFTTYLVGGCVRDLLINTHPKDFDIATAAVPQQVKKLIYMAFIIGKRFRLVLVKREAQQFEVATFRREVRPEDSTDPGQPTGDNIFGTPEEDAQRRDFTINGLFYDPINEQLIDYVHGLPDIEARVLRMIGDPETRLLEDSIRILRGLRLTHKLGFTIDPALRSAMQTHADSLAKSVLPRRREEILKMLRLDEPDRALLEAYDLGILKHVLPTLHDLLENTERRDLFLQYFEVFRTIVIDPSETTQLFGWLVYSILRSAQEAPSDRTEPLTIEDEIFQYMMREELGMYKFEQTSLSRAVELVPLLTKTDDFKRRGERRQLGLMKNEGFRLALRFAEADFDLSPSQLAFWRTSFESHAPEIEENEAEAKTKKRRRGRRRRPGERGEDDGSDGDRGNKRGGRGDRNGNRAEAGGHDSGNDSDSGDDSSPETP
jgi:poly(A) polymerase